MPAQVGYNLFDQRIHRATPAVHNALAANFDHINPGQNSEIGCFFRSLLHRGICQRTGNQLPAQCRKHAVLIFFYYVLHLCALRRNGVLHSQSFSEFKDIQLKALLLLKVSICRTEVCFCPCTQFSQSLLLNDDRQGGKACPCALALQKRLCGNVAIP